MNKLFMILGALGICVIVTPVLVQPLPIESAVALMDSISATDSALNDVSEQYSRLKENPENAQAYEKQLERSLMAAENEILKSKILSKMQIIKYPNHFALGAAMFFVAWVLGLYHWRQLSSSSK